MKSIRKLILASLVAAFALSMSMPTAFARGGADDPVGHDAGDDHGGKSGKGGGGTDDPAGHH